MNFIGGLILAAPFAGLIAWQGAAPSSGSLNSLELALREYFAANSENKSTDQELDASPRTVPALSDESAQGVWLITAESEEDRLSEFIRRFCEMDPRGQSLLRLWNGKWAPGQVATIPWLNEDELPRLVCSQLRLAHGRWLIEGRLYDEARAILEDLRPEEVIAPKTLLFCQAIVYHQLLEADLARKTAEELLKQSRDGPARYRVLAEMICADWARFEAGSLNDISRQMGDVARRLELGKADQEVLAREERILEALDKLIREAEKRAQKLRGASAGGATQSSSPAPDSLPLGGKGRGEVTARPVGSSRGWGDLPPKERDEILQSLGREFPPHYREVVEQYFRRLAEESESTRE